jgi:PAS domain S-box-containing protein
MSIKWKIACYIILPVVIIYVIIMSLNLNKIRKLENEKIHSQIIGYADKYATYIDLQLKEAAQLAEITAACMEDYPGLPSKGIYTLLENNLKLDHFVFGSAVCFMPYQYSKNIRLFARYAYRDGNFIKTSDPTTEGYDYTDKKQEYWHIPKSTGNAVWTTPYFDKGGGNILMSTYSVPFFKNKKFLGVATVDIPLEPLRELIDFELPKEFSFFLIGKNGKYVYSNFKEYINKSYSTINRTYKNSSIDDILKAPKEDKTGIIHIKNLKTNEGDILAYTSIESTNWTLIITLPNSLAHMVIAKQFFRSLIFLGIILIITVIGLFWISAKITAPVKRLNNAVKRFSNGDFSVKIKVESNDEIGELAFSFNKLGGDLLIRERQIGSSENKFRSLFDNMMNAFAFHRIVVNEEGVPIDYEFVDVNNVFEKLTGLKKENIIGQTVKKILPGIENDSADWINKYGKVALSGKAITFTNYSEPLGKWFSVSAYSPKIGYFATIFKDITEKKIAEKKVRDLARFPEENTNPVYRISKDGVLLYANSASRKLISEDQTEVGEKIPEKWVRMIKDVYDSGTQQTVELKFNEKIFLFEQIPIPESGYVNVYGIDVTESKKAEKVIEESKQRFKDIAESMSDWIWEVDEEGKYTYCSDKVYKVLGYAAEDVIGKTPFDFMPLQEGKKIKVFFEDILNQKKNIVNLENWNISKNGEKICILTNGTPFFDGDGNFKGYRGVDKNITERKEYEEKLQITNIEIENAHKHAIYMLALAAEYKDRETGDHIKRIADFTEELAIELGIEGKQAKRLGNDSILHDLGKLGISDYILLKPGKLTSEEFEIMKQHTVIGANIIGNDKWFIQARNIAMSHHEKWDGSGYPKGLKGNKIPFEARIVAVTDVFDALISKRPYKEPWTLEESVEEIKNGAGKHFDPKVVEAFLLLYKNNKLKQYTERVKK